MSGLRERSTRPGPRAVFLGWLDGVLRPAGQWGDERVILFATDAASEGIELQEQCHRLVHWEIPWNPNRLEQRNGRIDRHGQRAPEVLIHHFVSAGYADAESGADVKPGSLDGDLHFLAQAVRKVEQIRTDLGSVGPVIADR